MKYQEEEEKLFEECREEMAKDFFTKGRMDIYKNGDTIEEGQFDIIMGCYPEDAEKLFELPKDENEVFFVVEYVCECCGEKIQQRVPRWRIIDTTKKFVKICSKCRNSDYDNKVIDLCWNKEYFNMLKHRLNYSTDKKSRDKWTTQIKNYLSNLGLSQIRIMRYL